MVTIASVVLRSVIADERREGVRDGVGEVVKFEMKKRRRSRRSFVWGRLV
jgi:hypothetical protein